jgi:hypothetical protein
MLWTENPKYRTGPLTTAKMTRPASEGISWPQVQTNGQLLTRFPDFGPLIDDPARVCQLLRWLDTD